MKRILVFELNWMGDILFSFPFLRALRKAFPTAHIACAVVERYKELLDRNPLVDEVHVFSDKRGFLSLTEKLAFIRTLRKAGYDACFFFKPSRTKSIIAFLAGIPRRIGFTGKNAMLTERTENVSPGCHRADVFSALAARAGISVQDGTYEYFVGREDEKRVTALLKKVDKNMRRIVTVNPGGNWDAKRWPAERFTDLVKRILSRFENISVVVTGTGKDAELAERIVSQTDPRRCHALAGRTRLAELAAVFEKCALVISADSGPLHLASAVGTATVGLFGPTSPKITGPRGKGINTVITGSSDCVVPCYIEKCEKNYACMRSITVDEVFAAVTKVLE
ncbi:MAG: lipopolysaccharide heptosyltransferase II [Candidatus Omnitrophota bacterium]